MSATPPRPPAPDPANSPVEAPAFDRAEAFDLIEEIASAEGLPMEWMLDYRAPRTEQDT